MHLDESDGEAEESGEVPPYVGGDDMETLEGPCSEEGQRHACRVKNAYGCVELEQRCVDGTWTACEFMQDA